MWCENCNELQEKYQHEASEHFKWKALAEQREYTIEHWYKDKVLWLEGMLAASERRRQELREIAYPQGGYKWP